MKFQNKKHRAPFEDSDPVYGTLFSFSLLGPSFPRTAATHWVIIEEKTQFLGAFYEQLDVTGINIQIMFPQQVETHKDNNFKNNKS
jgi:hypothetical protein